MKFLKEMFNEKSNTSMMRMMSLLSLVIGAILALKGKNESVDIFVYAAFGGKAIQKFFEGKVTQNLQDQNKNPESK